MHLILQTEVLCEVEQQVQDDWEGGREGGRGGGGGLEWGVANCDCSTSEQCFLLSECLKVFLFGSLVLFLSCRS